MELDWVKTASKFLSRNWRWILPATIPIVGYLAGRIIFSLEATHTKKGKPKCKGMLKYRSNYNNNEFSLRVNGNCLVVIHRVMPNGQEICHSSFSTRETDYMYQQLYPENRFLQYGLEINDGGETLSSIKLSIVCQNEFELTAEFWCRYCI